MVVRAHRVFPRDGCSATAVRAVVSFRSHVLQLRGSKQLLKECQESGAAASGLLHHGNTETRPDLGCGDATVTRCGES